MTGDWGHSDALMQVKCSNCQSMYVWQQPNVMHMFDETQCCQMRFDMII